MGVRRNFHHGHMQLAVSVRAIIHVGCVVAQTEQGANKMAEQSAKLTATGRPKRSAAPTAFDQVSRDGLCHPHPTGHRLNLLHRGPLESTVITPFVLARARTLCTGLGHRRYSLPRGLAGSAAVE